MPVLETVKIAGNFSFGVNSLVFWSCSDCLKIFVSFSFALFDFAFFGRLCSYFSLVHA